jgi:hypothetical protein
MVKNRVSLADRVAADVLRNFPMRFTPGQQKLISLAIRQGIEMGEAIQRHRSCR